MQSSFHCSVTDNSCSLSITLLRTCGFSALDKESRSMVSYPIFAKCALASASLSRLRSAINVNRSAAPSSNRCFQQSIWLVCIPYSRDNFAMVFSSRAATRATLALHSGEWLRRFLLMQNPVR